MYDFWYALGVAIMEPELLNAINRENPDFEFLLYRIITDIPQDGGAPNTRVGASTGLLGDDPPADGTSRLGATTRVRNAIGGYLHTFSADAPPVGIYCAGRFSQLLSIPQFTQDPTSTFVNIIEMANRGYRNVDQREDYDSARFPAFLGLCLMDKNFTGAFGSGDERLEPIFEEFSISEADFAVAVAFSNTDEYNAAYSFLQDGGYNPWTNEGTLEQIFFWPGVSTYAIP